MTKLFAIKLYTYAMVVAEDRFEAEVIAEDEQRNIFSDTNGLEAEFEERITNKSRLTAYGWDERCLPYGGDGNTAIKDLILDYT